MLVNHTTMTATSENDGDQNWLYKRTALSLWRNRLEKLSFAMSLKVPLYPTSNLFFIKIFPKNPNGSHEFYETWHSVSFHWVIFRH